MGGATDFKELHSRSYLVDLLSLGMLILIVFVSNCVNICSRLSTARARNSIFISSDSNVHMLFFQK